MKKAWWVSVSIGGLGLMALGGPIVFWVGDPVRPNDTLMVAGAGFGTQPVVRLLALGEGTDRGPGDRVAWPSGAEGQILAPVQGSDESLKLIVPPDGKASAWLGRVENRETGDVSAPFRVNCPTVYWMQGDRGVDQASPGGWVEVFGRCVADEEGKGLVMLIREDGTARERLQPDKASPWRVKVSLPADMAPGAWRVYVHNGQGEGMGWGAPGSLVLAAPPSWPMDRFNVRDFGASGQGDYADTAGIQAALQQAEDNGGGIIFFPRGRYQFEGTLRLPRYTVIQGEAADLACICWPDSDEPYTLIEGTDHFGVEDITLYASNAVHGIAGDQRTPEAGHTFVRNVCLRAVAYRGHLKPEEVDRRFRDSLKLSTGGGDSIRLGGSNVEISGCDIYGSGRAFYLFGVRGGVVRDNRFYNGRWGWYCITGADGLIYEGNVLTGADLMSTGGGINCLGSISSRNVYYGGNTVARCHGWDREAMTSDAGGAAFHGKVARAEGVTLIPEGSPEWRGTARWPGGGVFILGGRGMGQLRRIVAVSDDGTSVTVDRAWNVIPDATSVISITMLQENYIFAENHFEDAGIGIQYYGTSANHIAWRNTSVRAGGFYCSGRWYHGYQPSWYCQFLENEIPDGNCYRFGPNNATSSGPSFIGAFGFQRGDNTAPLAFCAILKRNRLRSNAMIRIDGVSDENPGLRDVVIEHNLVANTDTGLDIGKGCAGVLCRENTFEKVDQITYDPARAREAKLAMRHELTDQEAPVYIQDFESRSGRFYANGSGRALPAAWRHEDVPTEPGLSGLCGRFGGTGFLEVRDRDLLRFPRITVSAWVLPDSLAGRWGIVAKRNRNVASAYVLAINNGCVTFEGTDTTGKWSYNQLSKPVLKESAWNHVAVTCEEGNMVRLYCNGVEVSAKEVAGELVDNGEPLTIGFEAWGGAGRCPDASGNFKGAIDEVRIWSRLLGPDEIRAEWERLAAAGETDVTRRVQASREAEEEQRLLAERFAAPPGDQWSPVAGETFDGPDLPRQWLAMRGTWTVRAGTLRSAGVSFLALDRAIVLPVRIEFDGRSAAPGDLTAFFGTKAKGYDGGYFVGFASNGNTANKILRLGQEVITSSAPNAVPGTWHHVVCEILADGDIVLAVDGKPALRYRDEQPVRSADTAGIVAWSDAEFDNLRIYEGKR